MSVGSEFQRSDAATGKECRPTVVSRNGGTSSCSDNEERSRWRPGRSEMRTICMLIYKIITAGHNYL